MSHIGRRVAYQKRFTDDDQMDVVFDTVRGRVVAFSVNYRARFDDKWNEVIRYDTHHGRLHVHRFWREKGRQITYLEAPDTQPGDYSKELDEAQADVADRWRHYRDHIRQRLR